MKWYLFGVVTCISLIINDIEYLITCLLAIYIVFGKMYIQVFCPFLIGFCLYCVVWAVYKFWILVPYLSSYLQWFLPFSRFSFHFISGFLCYVKAFKLIRSHFFCFYFFWLLFLMYSETDPKIYCYNLCWSALPTFFPRRFTVFTGQHWPSIALQLPDFSALPGPLNLLQRMFLPASGYNLIILGEDSDSFTEIFKMWSV